MIHEYTLVETEAIHLMTPTVVLQPQKSTSNHGETCGKRTGKVPRHEKLRREAGKTKKESKTKVSWALNAA